MRLTFKEQILANVILESLIQTETPVSYSEFALRLELNGPQKINRIMKWLEQITVEDASLEEPVRASMVFSRVTPGLPSYGFFAFCKEIGLFDWKEKPLRAKKFIKSQQKELFSKQNVCK